MMEDFLGTDSFRKGLKEFLVKYSYKSAVTKDLLSELAVASPENLDVVGVMDTWTRQKGYPVVTAKKAEGGGAYVLSQERFLADPDATSKKDVKSAYDYRWEIPVTYLGSDGRKKLEWMHKDGKNVSV